MTDTTAQEFAGKTVIVTGAAGGLGRAFALGFGALGANVVVADMNEAGSAETVRLLAEQGAAAVSIPVNVTSKPSTEALAEAALAHFGRIDVLVNNAAIYATLERSSFMDIDPEEWDRVMAVNVKGTWL